MFEDNHSFEEDDFAIGLQESEKMIPGIEIH